MNLKTPEQGRYGSKVSITDYANKIYKADLYIGNGIRAAISGREFWVTVNWARWES